MNDGIYELVQKILYGVAFIGIGGTLALVFFFVFAPSILGAKSINRQLEGLRHQIEQLNQQLARIARFLDKENDASESSGGSDDSRGAHRR